VSYGAGGLEDLSPGDIARAALLVTLAGMYAELRMSHRSRESLVSCPGEGAADDADRADEIIDWLLDRGFAADRPTAWQRSQRELRDFLCHRWPAITRVAEALRKRGRLEPTDVVALTAL
jgi:hypothetical protein